MHTVLDPKSAQETDAPINFDALFHPRTIAVAGVSNKAEGQGNRFIQRLRRSGYKGIIYPIHPTESELEGLPAYTSLGETPEPIDYAFIAIPAEGVPDLIANAGGRVKFAQVMSSGFGEGGKGEKLQAALVDALRIGKVRLLGPNCLGVYSPEAGMTFVDGQMGTAGPIGIFSQSGGLSVDIIKHGEYRGLRFNGVVTLGNCLDVGPCDLLEYYLSVPKVKVIGAYIETVQEGRRFFEILRAANARKPVVILKGGRTEQGQRAAASHTGSLAGNDQVWKALASQTGSVLVETLEEFIDTLVTFQNWGTAKKPFRGNVVLFGNGGGASVLACDALGRLGIELPAIGADTSIKLNALGISAGASLENPLDFPANILNRFGGELFEKLLQIVIDSERPEILLIHLNLPVILPYRSGVLMTELMSMVLKLHASLPKETSLFLVLRSTGQTDYEDQRQKYATIAMQAGIPTFQDLTSAARALGALKRYGTYFNNRSRSSDI
jgi:acyl-CoA synthetase (NDP forming)